jgi:hypothetical protein
VSGDGPNTNSIGLTKAEIVAIAEGWPQLLTVGQAARIASVPVGTIYDWSSAGRLARCARRRGKRLLIVRDRFIEELFNGKEW